MYAVYNVFNNEKTINQSLLSILPFVEKIVAVDGAYRLFPHTTPYSTDATKSVLRRLCKNKLIWQDCKVPWKSQVEKKNKIISLVPDGKWFIRLSADETIEGNIVEAFRFAESSTLQNIGVVVKNYQPIWNGYEVRHTGKHHAYPYLDKPIPKACWDQLKWRENYGIGNRIVLARKGLHFQGHHSTMFVGSKLQRVQIDLKDVLIVNRPQEIGWKRWHQKVEYKRRRYEEKDFEG